MLASIDKQLVIEQDACIDPHNVDKNLIVDHVAHIRHAVGSDRVNEKRARPQDREDANLNKTGECEDKKALRFQARLFCCRLTVAAVTRTSPNMFRMF